MIYTYYSFKGGVGRSMALANIAELLYQSGFRVLMVDWDLEAPGLERFFFSDTKPIQESLGVMDMVLEYKQLVADPYRDSNSPFLVQNITKYLHDIYPDSKKGKLQLLTAGSRIEQKFSEYANTARTFDWVDFYNNWGGEIYFEWLRREFSKKADIVLVDSRTGITEMGGVCTYQLSDAIIMFCGPNEQNLSGTLLMAQDFSRKEVKELRGKRDLPLVIVPARIERAESPQLDIFKEDFIKLFEQFIPPKLGKRRNTFWDLRIPYVPRYAYRELLAAREQDSALADDLIKPYKAIIDIIIRLDPSLQLKLRTPWSERIIRQIGSIKQGSKKVTPYEKELSQELPSLRIIHTKANDDIHNAEIRLVWRGKIEYVTAVQFQYQASNQDNADMRWYFEDFLTYPADPALEIAQRIEGLIRVIGEELFDALFSNADAQIILGLIRPNLDEARIEIVESPSVAGEIPWELLRDPKTEPLALSVKSFVHGHSLSTHAHDIYTNQPEKVRILVVICRPGGSEDVPFRSVASQLVKGLGDAEREHFELDVLRPPTFEQLSQTLHDAKAQGRSYHILHFDGHGGYVDLAKVKAAEVLDGLMPLIVGGRPRPGQHGYLLFENPKKADNIDWVDGSILGKLMIETGVPVLIINACRSAHEDITLTPTPSSTESWNTDDHQSIRAFGSLAQEVMDAGVAGVVAMRYNVYVVTAAQFVADLYAALSAGQTLGEAASLGRKQLAAQPLREIAFEPHPLQDWSVPVVYEAAPIQLFPRLVVEGRPPLRIDLTPASRPSDDLPRPEVGFYGRDETLLALDRAFDTQPVVLLHAYAGSGKTMTAVEFARWYQQTGGLNVGGGAQVGAKSPASILFTSFEQYKPLERVLDTVEQVFRILLEANNIQWLALDLEARRNVTLQIFKQISVLWIWDNIEPVNGFPAGTPSAWTETAQRELKSFLQDASGQTRAKFLLTSRRDERAWLGDLPRRVSLPPMPGQEMVQLARALADKTGYRLAEVDDWRPLLRFTQGNPLTITVMIGQALRLVAEIKDKDPERQRAQRKAKLQTYLERLRLGETAFSDEASQGRATSLGASLAYGFENTFTEDERKALALLHLFQGFVDASILALMSSGFVDIIEHIEHEQVQVAFLPIDKSVVYILGVPVSSCSLHESLNLSIRSNDVLMVIPTATRETFIGGSDTDNQVYEQGGQVNLLLPKTITSVEWLSKLSREVWIKLLDRAADGGLLTSHGNGYYSVHPGLVWYFRTIFELHYIPEEAQKVKRAFVEAMSTLGIFYHEQYADGNRDIIGLLRAEEANLLFARGLARSSANWNGVMGTMQGIRALYDHTGRRSEWRRLVDEIVPDFVDSDTGGPLPKREEQWSLVTEYRVRLEIESRRWEEAARLQRILVDENRRRAAALLNLPLEQKNDISSNVLRTLAVTISGLGNILREQGNPECVDVYKESVELCQKIKDKTTESTLAFNLGRVHTELPSLRNLEEAERWFRCSLELTDEIDHIGRAQRLGQLGLVAYERFLDARQAQKQGDELVNHLNTALSFYQQALALLSLDAVDDRAVTCYQIGNIYISAGELENAISYYIQAIRYHESAGNLYAAGQARFNTARALAQSGRLSDALLYARATLRNFESYGAGAAEVLERTKRLIAVIENDMTGRISSPSTP